MIGGLKKTTSLLALVAAAGFIMGGTALTPAKAADLGGDCCADLEERVAELEATTARKGNRKVSLTISGHVARSIGWYDDEYDYSEFYSAGNGVSGSRVQFAGSAELVPGWTAGYTLRLRFNGDRTSDVLMWPGQSGGPDAGVAAGVDSDPNVTFDRNFVYLKSDRLGTFVIGQAGAPTDGIAEISLAGRDVTGDASGTDWNDSGIQGFDLEQGTHQAIAYISPTLYGFTFAAAWADLDIGSFATPDDDSAVDAWDLALRYAREFGPMRLAAGIGYTTTDNDKAGSGYDGGNLMGSVALMHVPTGLNIAFSAGTETDGGIDGNGASDANFWFIEGGINRDFTGLGNTSIYAEYGDYDYDTGVTAMDLYTTTWTTNGWQEDKVTMWGVGVVQHFDKAATELFLAYRHWERDGVGTGAYDDGNAVHVLNAYDGDVDQIMAGMRIKF